MARSTFYYNHRPKPDKWAVERRRIAELYHQNKGRYGYRRLAMAMRNEGYVINGKTVRKLMAEAGIKCQVRMKKYKSYKGEVGKIAPNLLERDFKADAPHKKMVTDVTEFHLFGSKLYLSPVLDLYNSELIFYTIYRHPVLDMVKDMINGTISVIGSNTNAILHSDQGFHYQHKDYQKLLKDNHIIQSMSRKGNCLDNAVMENFFGLLKSTELTTIDLVINPSKKRGALHPSRGLAHFSAQEADSVADLFRVDEESEAGRPTEGVRGASSGRPWGQPRSGGGEGFKSTGRQAGCHQKTKKSGPERLGSLSSG